MAASAWTYDESASQLPLSKTISSPLPNHAPSKLHSFEVQVRGYATPRHRDTQWTSSCTVFGSRSTRDLGTSWEQVVDETQTISNSPGRNRHGRILRMQW